MDFDPDAPIRAFDRDEFHFGPFARGVARDILLQWRTNCFVIGIDGPWGVGKTSLLNLLDAAIGEQAQAWHESAQPLVFHFSPWIIENREALLREFLPQLAKRLRRQIPWKKRPDKAKNAIRSLARYGRAVRGAELGFGVASATATLFSLPVPPLLAPLSALFAAIGQFFGHQASRRVSLDELRQDTRKALEAADIRVVVVIDDLDRLEPEEILSVCRLVKSTADLPRMTFVISYDREKAAEYIHNELRVNGEEYLEKIIQLPLRVPPVSGFDLAKVLASKLTPVFGDLEDDQAKRTSKLLWVHMRRLFLRAPRDVGRILNQTMFAWSTLKGEADPGDVLLVSSLQVKAPNVLRWCRAYCETFHNDRALQFDKETTAKRFREDLKAACAVDEMPEKPLFDCLGDTLPGMGNFLSAEAGLFAGSNPDAQEASIANQRISSEQHWPIYFDLTPGRYGFTEAWLSEFVANAAANPEKAADDLVGLISQGRPAGGNYAEYLLDRLRAKVRTQRLSEEQCRNLFQLFASVADRADATAGQERGMFEPTLGNLLEWIGKDLLRGIRRPTRVDAFAEALRHGISIGWTMSMLRDELFAHGRGSDAPKDEEQILRSTELDDLCAVAENRILSEANAATLLTSHDLTTTLFAWLQLKEDDAKRWVADICQANENFLTFVESFRRLVISSSGNYWAISPKSLGYFLDAATAQERLERIAGSGIGEIKTRAVECVDAIIRNRDRA